MRSALRVDRVEQALNIVVEQEAVGADGGRFRRGGSVRSIQVDAVR
jgi:hypothetical protein